jgi:putative glutamine amidotransferase
MIGITERRLATAQIAGVPPTILDTWMSAQLVNYARAVVRAGGLPVHISREADPVALVRRVDGLVFAGGLDVDPRLYGGVPGPESTVIDPESDRFDAELLLEALQADVPVLGICRGMQLINVALGGTLVEHLPLGVGSSHSFVLYPPHERVHSVSLQAGSRVQEVYGQMELMVNSLHHQAVGRPGQDVVVTAWAEDGVAEALQVEGQRILAVQWHPEFFREPDPVFDWLVAEARVEETAVRVTEQGAGVAGTGTAESAARDLAGVEIGITERGVRCG